MQCQSTVRYVKIHAPRLTKPYGCKTKAPRRIHLVGEYVALVSQEGYVGGGVLYTAVCRP